ncbi:MAG: Fe-S cluster assembly protein SufD [Marinoscillum sp.]|uniref:Fe-S cluster assembly protein SufD n=1 Tax=Marinoscillum sp. TaxID=2024838 RepID=UPI0032FFA935
MSEVLSIEQTISEQFQQWIGQHFADESPLKALKTGALEQFSAMGLPAPKSEAYKYTPISRILGKQFNFAAEMTPANFSKADCQSHFYQAEDANHLVFINGLFTEEYSSIVSPSSDLTIRVLDDQALTEHSDIQRLLGKTSHIESDAFALLNLAYFNQGLYLKASKNKDNKDTFIYHFVDGTADASIVYPRILVSSETGSRLNIFEKTIIRGEQNTLSVSIFEADVQPNAELRYTKIQNFLTSTYAVEGIYATQGKDSRFYTNTFSFKAALIRNNIYINVDAENCEAHMNGLYQLGGKSHVDNNTSVDHLKPNCFSNELYKGILDENSRGVFNGKIYVRPEAQKTNAFQSNNNILLSDTATVNTKPQLEIWADDVKCSHGCTTGQLDEEAIFYLRSRGINKKRAKALMLNAFANETLQEVKNDLVTAEIEDIITNKLG